MKFVLIVLGIRLLVTLLDSAGKGNRQVPRKPVRKQVDTGYDIR